MTIRLTAPDETIQYNCSNHNGMGANINVTTDSIGGLTTLDVDSTIGFPLSGELFVTYNDESTGVIQYTSKSINQFLVAQILQELLKIFLLSVLIHMQVMKVNL